MMMMIGYDEEYGLVPVLKKCPHRGSVRVRTPPIGSHGVRSTVIVSFPY